MSLQEPTAAASMTSHAGATTKAIGVLAGVAAVFVLSLLALVLLPYAIPVLILSGTLLAHGLHAVLPSETTCKVVSPKSVAYLLLTGLLSAVLTYGTIAVTSRQDWLVSTNILCGVEAAVVAILIVMLAAAFDGIYDRFRASGVRETYNAR